MPRYEELYMEANDEYVKWAASARGDELSIDMWIEAYMAGYASAMKKEAIEIPEELK